LTGIWGHGIVTKVSEESLSMDVTEVWVKLGVLKGKIPPPALVLTKIQEHDTIIKP
jgi:hypothetical protein